VRRSATATQETHRCSNAPGGFSLAYPRDWVTNAGDLGQACTWFWPKDAASGAGPDDRPAPIHATVGPASFEEAASPLPDEVDRATTTLAGHRAVRIRRAAATGGTATARRTPVVAYVVDLSSGPAGRDGTLVLDAAGTADVDLPAAERVLDRMARSLELFVDTADDGVVARCGDGETGPAVPAVLASPSPGGDETCLSCLPSGAPTCFPPPEPDGVRFLDLAPGEDGVDAFGGVAGAEVFRVVVERRGRDDLACLPVPVAGASDTAGGPVKGWALPVATPDVTAVAWYDAEGRGQGRRPGPHVGPPPG
jgi:hypothetical protein